MPRKSLEERFREKTCRGDQAPPGLELPCLLWTGCLLTTGYGQLRLDGKGVQAHRVAFFLAHGRWPIPCALHRCDAPRCVEPTHLQEGTQGDNLRDMFAKGRSVFQQHPERRARGERNGSRTKPERLPRGEGHGQAALSADDVRTIRTSNDTGITLAARFNVNATTISKIRRKETWRHI